MLAIPAYSADYQAFTMKDGNMTSAWHPCRVIGITNDADGDPAYLVEFASAGGVMHLAVEPYVRPRPSVSH